VNTFSLGLISPSGIPFAANPWKIAGKLLQDWPCTALFSDSNRDCEIQTVDAFAVISIEDPSRLTEWRVQLRPLLEKVSNNFGFEERHREFQ
jgi:hypothetical protein